LAEKTISYAAAKTAHYEALRAAMPELTDIATGKKPRPPEVDQFGQAFLLSGRLEKVTDDATAALLSKLPLESDIQKAKAAFDQAQAVEEQFLRDFEGVDFTESVSCFFADLSGLPGASAILSRYSTRQQCTTRFGAVPNSQS
jgi:hypothetical protein